MAVVSEALKRDIPKYVEYRFSHFSPEKKERRVFDIFARISEVTERKAVKFHADMLRFFDTNKAGIKRVKEVKINPIQNIEVEKFMGNKPSKDQMLKLIQKYDGNFNQIIKEHNGDDNRINYC